MLTEIITRPACGHKELVPDCVKCLAHHLDLTRHAEAMLRKIHNERRRSGITIHVVKGRKRGGK